MIVGIIHALNNSKRDFMNKMISKLFILFSLVIVSACGSSNMNANSSDQLGSAQITSFTYQVSGGGDIQFTITPSGYGSFLVNVTRYNFQTRNQTLNLNNSTSSYSFVSSIFQKSVQITAAPVSNSYSGTFSQITINAGSSSVTIQKPTVNGDTSQFSMLYQTIASQLY